MLPQPEIRYPSTLERRCLALTLTSRYLRVTGASVSVQPLPKEEAEEMRRAVEEAEREVRKAGAAEGGRGVRPSGALS